MSDTSYSSERSVEVSDDPNIEVRDAGVQACVGSISPSCSEESDNSECTGGFEYTGHPRVPWEEKLAQAKVFKQEGNEKYKSGAHKSAIGKYHRALLYLKGINDAQQSAPLMPVMEDAELSKAIPDAAQSEVKQLQIDCYNNLSGTFLWHVSHDVDGDNMFVKVHISPISGLESLTDIV